MLINSNTGCIVTRTRTENEVIDTWHASLGGISHCLLRFFFFNPLHFFKIRISLLHSIAVHLQFCPVPWSPLSRATSPLSQAQCSAGWENKEQETFPCYSQSSDSKLTWDVSRAMTVLLFTSEPTWIAMLPSAFYGEQCYGEAGSVSDHSRRKPVISVT